MKKIIILLTLFICLCSNLWASAAGNVRSGNKHYKKGDYEKSLENFRQAQISQPNNPIINFNIGNALYKSENADEAGVQFQKALNSKDTKLRSKTYYNLGNAAYAKQKTDEAIDYYKKALELNPNDWDAKYNIEFILNQKANPSQNKKDEDKQDKDKKDKKDKTSNEKSAKKSGKIEDKKDKSGMSKEDAQRILQVFDEQDKNSAQKRKMAVPQIPKTDEDW